MWEQLQSATYEKEMLERQGDLPIQVCCDIVIVDESLAVL